jgi:hypothetical protein
MSTAKGLRGALRQDEADEIAAIVETAKKAARSKRLRVQEVAEELVRREGVKARGQQQLEKLQQKVADQAEQADRRVGACVTRALEEMDPADLAAKLRKALESVEVAADGEAKLPDALDVPALRRLSKLPPPETSGTDDDLAGVVDAEEDEPALTTPAATEARSAALASEPAGEV